MTSLFRMICEVLALQKKKDIALRSKALRSAPPPVIPVGHLIWVCEEWSCHYIEVFTMIYIIRVSYHVPHHFFFCVFWDFLLSLQFSGASWWVVISADFLIIRGCLGAAWSNEGRLCLEATLATSMSDRASSDRSFKNSTNCWLVFFFKITPTYFPWNSLYGHDESHRNDGVSTDMMLDELNKDDSWDPTFSNGWLKRSASPPVPEAVVALSQLRAIEELSRSFTGAENWITLDIRNELPNSRHIQLSNSC